MKWLIAIMRYSRKWGYDLKPWFLNELDSKIINHAHRLGLVYRPSTSQVEWTEKGAALAKKYMD